MIDLSGRTALVTGASRGIGAAAARALADLGAGVMIGYIVERPAAERVVQRIREAGGTAESLAADLSKRSEAEMLIAETVDRFGTLDILVNNAGIWSRSATEEMTDTEWETDACRKSWRSVSCHACSDPAPQIDTWHDYQRKQYGRATGRSVPRPLCSDERCAAIMDEIARCGTLPGWHPCKRGRSRMGRNRHDAGDPAGRPP